MMEGMEEDSAPSLAVGSSSEAVEQMLARLELKQERLPGQAGHDIGRDSDRHPGSP